MTILYCKDNESIEDDIMNIKNYDERFVNFIKRIGSFISSSKKNYFPSLKKIFEEFNNILYHSTFYYELITLIP